MFREGIGKGDARGKAAQETPYQAGTQRKITVRADGRRRAVGWGEDVRKERGWESEKSRWAKRTHSRVTFRIVIFLKPVGAAREDPIRTGKYAIQEVLSRDWAVFCFGHGR